MRSQDVKCRQRKQTNSDILKRGPIANKGRDEVFCVILHDFGLDSFVNLHFRQSRQVHLLSWFFGFWFLARRLWIVAEQRFVLFNKRLSFAHFVAFPFYMIETLSNIDIGKTVFLLNPLMHIHSTNTRYSMVCNWFLAPWSVKLFATSALMCKQWNTSEFCEEIMLNRNLYGRLLKAGISCCLVVSGVSIIISCFLTCPPVWLLHPSTLSIAASFSVHRRIEERDERGVENDNKELERLTTILS